MSKRKEKQLLPKLTPLPCPFCGKAPVVQPKYPGTDGNAWGGVRCVNARCEAQPSVLDGCNVADERGSGAYKDLAIKKWNKRATKDAPALEAVPDEHQQFIDSLDAEDKMFAQIEKWAHESYRRHRSSVRGQQVTAADDPNSHYIWAALRWAKENPAKQEAAPLAAPGWISVHERLPEVDELVLLYWPPGPYDHPNEPNYGFDCIDPNDDERASWMGHNENYEHFCCVAKPEGSVGPASKAPYTHWMPLPAAPTNAKESTS